MAHVFLNTTWFAQSEEEKRFVYLIISWKLYYIVSHHNFAMSCYSNMITSKSREGNAVFLFYMLFLNAGEFAENWPSHTQHLIYSLLTILTVKIMGFIDLQKSFINGSVSMKVTMEEAGLWKKLRKWKYISEFNRSSELHDRIDSKDRQKAR